MDVELHSAMDWLLILGEGKGGVIRSYVHYCARYSSHIESVVRISLLAVQRQCRLHRSGNFVVLGLLFQQGELEALLNAPKLEGQKRPA